MRVMFAHLLACVVTSTFNRALLKLHPGLRAYGGPLTEAMVEFYARNQERFSPDTAPHYIYSPRELSRWMRAMYEAMEPLESLDLDGLVRLWAHEGLRLFHDRLMTSEERKWCQACVREVAWKHFTGANRGCLTAPILYSNWLSRTYESVDRDELRRHVEARLKVFYEEELDVPLVVFDDVLDHVLRIDRVLRQPLGHLLLVGESGAGKTVLTRFVAWTNALSVFQIKVSRRYTIGEFDDDLRAVLTRAGCDGEQICFIFDESNVLSSAFLERMNALLASGEVPGLFEGDAYTALLNRVKESSLRGGAIVDSEEDLFRTFTRNVQRNLHVVFTMNPASGDFDNRAATSPALFNRCVVDWFGDWSRSALGQVGRYFLRTLDLDYADYAAPPEAATLFADGLNASGEESQGIGDIRTYHDAVAASLVRTHELVRRATVRLGRRTGRTFFVSPRDYVDFINHYVSLYVTRCA